MIPVSNPYGVYMKAVILFISLVLFGLSTGCASSRGTNRYDAALASYRLRAEAASVTHPRITLKVPDGSTLQGGFELNVSDPSDGITPMAVPESDLQAFAKTFKDILPWLAGAYVGGKAVEDTVVETPAPTVVRPEVITVPSTP
jgi:hypothetical protein